jgi:hypothetical protein
MESQCIRVKLKEGMTDTFLAWAKSLSSRNDEIRQALQAEGMSMELLLLERCNDGDYVVLYTRARNLVEANSAFQNSELRIDQEAKQIMAETWDFATIKPVEKFLEVIL